MATALRTPVEEYLSRHYEPECELINGELVPKPMGTLEHGDMQYKLRRILERYEAKGLGRIAQELSYRKGEDFRIPDLVFAPQDARYQHGFLVQAPLLCVEILSPSQRLSELAAKCEAYHTWGVPYCWVIDPIKKLAWEYHNDSPLRLLAPEASLQAGEIAVALSELFA
jgi:Uma2 family endonuclease